MKVKSQFSANSPTEVISPSGFNGSKPAKTLTAYGPFDQEQEDDAFSTFTPEAFKAKTGE